jgi:hypothetical protein
MHGTGVILWQDETRYEGKFKFCKMDGNGISKVAKGDRFVGRFKND